MRELLSRVQALTGSIKGLLRRLRELEGYQPSERQNVLNERLLSLLEEVSEPPSDIMPYLREIATEVKEVAADWDAAMIQKLPPDLRPGIVPTIPLPELSPEGSSQQTVRLSHDTISLQQHFRQIEELRYQGKWEDAIQRYDNILRLVAFHELHEQAQASKQKALSAQKRYDLTFNKLPESIKRSFQMALSQERSGRYQQAEAYYQQARREALSYGITDWTAIESYWRTREQDAQVQKTLNQAQQWIKEERWENALTLLQEAMDSPFAAKYQTHITTLKTLIDTFDTTQQQVRLLGSQLHQANRQPTKIEAIIIELEDAQDRLRPLVHKYPESSRLRRLRDESESLWHNATQQLQQGAQQLQHLLTQAQLTSDIDRKTYYLRQAVGLALDALPANQPNLSIHQQLQTLLDLAERANQTIQDITIHLTSADYRDIHQATQRLEEIHPTLLHTRALKELEQQFVQTICHHIQELTKSQHYHPARQLIGLLKKEIFSQQITQAEIERLEDTISQREKPPVLTRTNAISFLLGAIVIVACLLILFLYLYLKG